MTNAESASGPSELVSQVVARIKHVKPIAKPAIRRSSDLDTVHGLSSMYY